VPANEVLDAAGYKRIYNESLMNLVERRLDRLRSGELGVNDYTMKNAVPFLQRLHQAGIRLYLASGTDEADVIREAEQLGYAALFEGRIYGASHDVTHDAKLMVLNRIIGEIGREQASHIVTFGDGPVEIRETRRRGGVTVGLASNEIQRCGLQLEKRTRVIRAGAHLVVPDFTDMDALLGLLHIRA
jgi:phosphoglycolate phosphatase-like HAD superfamily hydrolase